ncbi:hypothetical protein, partial [Romboutsia sp.]|uniref:hypothetical protein n=1 Tax=Romboutsia sp. TaxID=1965302 RepID=UPI002D021CFF
MEKLKTQVELKEVNVDGIGTQKRQLKTYLFDTLGLPKSEKIDVPENTMITEGFVVEGYKIKYNIGGLVLDFSKDKIDYHTEKAIISTKLMELFTKLQHEFDIKPDISTIVDSTKATKVGFGFKKEECDIYKVIDHIEITKEKQEIYDIDDVRMIDVTTEVSKTHTEKEGSTHMEKIIKITEGKYQDFRKEVLANLGMLLKIVFGDKFITWNFDKNSHIEHEPTHVSKEEYIENMIEKEILEVYQHLVFGGIRTGNNEYVEIKPLTSKYQVCTIESEPTQQNTKNNEGMVNTMRRLTKKELMAQIKIMRNDLMDGCIEKCADDLGTYKKINETELHFWGITEKAYDYMLELKDCTLLKTPAFKTEVAKWVAGDFDIVGNIKIVVNGIFGTAEVLVDVEEKETGKIVKDMCFLWDNNCKYSRHEELRKIYPDAEKEFKQKQLYSEINNISDGTMATLLGEQNVGECRKNFNFIKSVREEMERLIRVRRLHKTCETWMDVWENVKNELNYEDIGVYLGITDVMIEEISLDDAMRNELETAEPAEVANVLEKIFISSDMSVCGGYYVLSDYFTESDTLGEVMLKKIDEILVRGLEVSKITDTEMYVLKQAKEQMELDDATIAKIEVLEFKKEGTVPEYEDFLTDGMFKEIDAEKIEIFKMNNISVEIVDGEVVMYDVTEQLEGQVDLIAYEKSVEVNKLESPIKVKKVIEEKVTFDIDGEGREEEVIDVT